MVWLRLFRKRPSARDLDDELAAHLAIETRLLVERGVSPEEAVARTRQSFGNRTLAAEGAPGSKQVSSSSAAAVSPPFTGS